MQSILQNLFSQHNFREDQYSVELQRILTNKGMLKKGFNKWQNKILLNITDDYGLIADEMAADSFIAGVRYGVKFMVEVFDIPSEQ